MRNRKEKAIAKGFNNADFTYLYKLIPFWKKGKVGVLEYYSGMIILKPEFSYIEVFEEDNYIYFIVKIGAKYRLYSSYIFSKYARPINDDEYDSVELIKEEKYNYLKIGIGNNYGLFETDGYGKITELVPIAYSKFEIEGAYPILFIAYLDAKSEQFDLYGKCSDEGSGLIAKNCKDCDYVGTGLIIKFIDNQQAMYRRLRCVIEKGDHEIQPQKDFIHVIKDNKVVVHNYYGYKLSQDISGKWERFGKLSVHITDNARTFYDENGTKIDLTQYEDYREEEEFVFVKSGGLWYCLWCI